MAVGATALNGVGKMVVMPVDILAGLTLASRFVTLCRKATLNIVDPMLIEFSVENFRSIKEEARLSLVASRRGEYRETHLVTPDLTGGVDVDPLVRSAVIYGANAAGKTNLVRALDVMKRIVTRSTDDLDELPVTPFRFDPDCEAEVTMFEVMCIAEGVRYQYGFKAKREMVTDEWLFAWPRGRVQVWFERALERWNLGANLTGDKAVWRRATRSNALYLSTAVSLNSRQLRPIYDWFKKHVARRRRSGLESLVFIVVVS